MASSSFSPSRSSSLRSRRLATSLDSTPFGLGAGTAALVLSVVLLLVASLVAPEQPGSLGSICQRHNGAEACRVW